MVDRDEFEYLVKLLDDADNVVAGCVDKRLREYGTDAVDMLFSMSSRTADSTLKEIMCDKAEALNCEMRLAAFADFAAGGVMGHMSLFEGSFLISSMMDAGLRRDSYEDMYVKCSSEYVAESSDQRTAVENIRIFNHIFFHRLHFSIYDVEMREMRYALISEALRTRQGNPFAVAYIYLMVAQFAGLPLRVLTFPGGFVPVYVENGKELFYINVYRNGEIFLKERLMEFISALGLSIAQDAFQLRDEAALMTIYLESLQFICSNKGDERKSRALGQALDCLGAERFLSIDEEA